MKKLTGQILWLIIAIYAFAVLLPSLFPKLESPLNGAIDTAALCAFALIHASLRYRIRDIAVFVVVCLVVSNFMENLSIMTGFPFGHYYYSDALGPKLFLVPVPPAPSRCQPDLLLPVSVQDSSYANASFIKRQTSLARSFLTRDVRFGDKS
jgi:hypothetical protein